MLNCYLSYLYHADDKRLCSVEYTIIMIQYDTGHGEALTSISANADGPRDAASRKMDHNTLPPSIITRRRASPVS